MSAYSTFFLAATGAAATLLGLLFIAIQFNIDTFARDPSNRWRATARSTFAIYVLLFVLPLLLLLPGITAAYQGSALIFGAVFGIFRALWTWWPVWRAALQRREERWLQLLRLLVGPLVVYGLLIYSGVRLLQGRSPQGYEIGIALSLVGLFVIALFNSWNLLVELTYERKSGSKRN